MDTPSSRKRYRNSVCDASEVFYSDIVVAQEALNSKYLKSDVEMGDCMSSITTAFNGSSVMHTSPHTPARKYLPAGNTSFDLRTVDLSLVHDMIQSLRDIELQQQEMYGGSISDDKIRSTVVEWMLDLQKSFGLTATAISLAVLLFDISLSTISVNAARLQALTAACVLIAVKFHEPDLPDAIRLDLDALLDCCDSSLTPMDITRAELLVLQQGLKWQVNVATAQQFMQLLLQFPIPEEEDGRLEPHIVANLRNYSWLLSEQFGLYALQDPALQRSLPSAVAACCIIAARRTAASLLGITLDTEWPVVLQRVTNFTAEMLVSVADLLCISAKAKGGLDGVCEAVGLPKPSPKCIADAT
eukprot:TRINITY_DN4504_c0_g1_i1.p1 TRINITY_DN4504_c0_g1~~TRINITY_DN4504_c0_g1_i1.p1  ORF type:complete len:358 (+),score=87.51 TRINITY_DN4504_c0_g1_i1:94-1167(+)